MQVQFKLKFIQHWFDHLNRHRYRIRRNGKILGELPVNGDPSSPEFMAAYHAILRGDKPAVAVAGVAALGGSGSIGDALARYFRSDDFLVKLPSLKTQSLRKSLLRGFTQAPASTKPVTVMESEDFIKQWIEDNSSTAGAKRTRWLAIRPFLAWAKAEKLIAVNPTDTYKAMLVKGGSHEAMGADEIAQFRAAHALGTMERLAFELLLHIGPRASDLIKLGRQNVKMRKGSSFLVFTPEKTRKHDVHVDTPIPVEVQQAIDACPGPAEALTFLTSERGRPFAYKAFNDFWRNAVTAAGLDPNTYHAHGMRHTCGHWMAENGCTAHEIMARLGHLTLKQAELYTKGYDRARANARAATKLANAA
jgi:integrase